MNKEKSLFFLLLFLIFVSSIGTIYLLGENKNIAQILTFEKEIKVGDKAFNITKESIIGTPVYMKDRKTILIFFSTTCPTCHKAILLINKHINKLDNKQLNIIGISTEKPAILKKRINNFKLTYPVISDSDREIFIKYRIKTVITIVIIDEFGKVLYYQDPEESLEKALCKIK